MSNDKTLATAKHGGCVKLGDADPVRAALLDALQFVETLHSTVGGESRNIVWRCIQRGRAALSAQPSPASSFDLESMLAACVPGGSIVDPQVVADNIRQWISAQPSPGGQDALSAQAVGMLPDDARIVGVIADNIERGKLDHPGFYRNTQLAEVLRRVLSAALAARQPTPGGQGDALLESLVARWRRDADEVGISDNTLCQKIANCTMRHAAELQAVLAARQLVSAEDWSRSMAEKEAGQYVGAGAHGIPDEAAARQPVGEPERHLVGYMDPDAEFMLARPGDCVLMGQIVLWREPGSKYTKPLYDAPPAQAVDLGQLWVSVNDRLPSEEDYGESGDVVVRYRYNTPNSVQGEWDVGESRHDADDMEWNNGWLFGSCDYAEVSHWMPKSALLDLIDSQAVGK